MLATAFRCEPEVEARAYQFTVPLHRRHRAEFVIDATKFEPGELREGDNPLLEVLALQFKAAGHPVEMHVRIYQIRFVPIKNLLREVSASEVLQEVDDIMELNCSIGQRHEPVYAKVTDI